MSEEKTSALMSECLDCDEEGILKTILPREKDLGGFSVKRLLPAIGQRMVGPWIFFDHMGPAQFEPGPGINVLPHPHIHLATVTYLFEGEIYHKDSVGSEQAIRPGDINLMVAGHGIVHSERERPEMLAQSRQLNGLQLWLALPEPHEDIDPAFYHYPSSEVPAFRVGEAPVRLMMGEAFGRRSPVKTFAETLYLEAQVGQRKGLKLPASLAEELALYVVEGAASIGQKKLGTNEMAILDPQQAFEVTSDTEARVAVLGGEKLGDRYIFWNFVSSKKESIEAAKVRWRNQEFPKVPGDDQEFIPLPVT